MAYITQAHSNIFPAIWEKISGFFVTVGRSLVLSAAMDSRLKRVEALNLKTLRRALMFLVNQGLEAHFLKTVSS